MSTSNIISLAQLMLHPPLSFLRRELIPQSPFTGHGVFNRTRAGILTDAWGIAWALDTAPPGFGRIATWSQDAAYDRQIIQIVVHHTLSDSTDVRSQIELSDRPVGAILFGESFPFSVTVDTAPGCIFTLHWLLFLP